MKVKSLEGNVITLQDKAPRYKSAYLGGTLFGLGWAMTGACPGPMYALVGSGTTVMLLAVLAGVLGVYVYAALRDKLLTEPPSGARRRGVRRAEVHPCVEFIGVQVGASSRRTQAPACSKGSSSPAGRRGPR